MTAAAPPDPMLERALEKLRAAVPEIFATMAAASTDHDNLARRWGLSFQELDLLEKHFAGLIWQARRGVVRPARQAPPLPAAFDRELPPRDRVEGK